VKPCLSLRLVRFFLSCIRSLGPVRGVAGREGREPLLSVSVSSSLGTMLSMEPLRPEPPGPYSSLVLAELLRDHCEAGSPRARV